MAFITPTAGRVDIAIALAPFLVVHRCRVTIAPSLAVELPSRRPSPSRRTIHHRPVSIVTSIAFYRRFALGPLPSSSRCPSPSRSRRTIHCHRGAVVLSLTIEELSRRPLPPRSRRAVSRRHRAIGRVNGPPSQWPESSPTFVTRHVPPRPRLRLVVALPLLTSPPPICQRLSLWHCLSCLSSVWLVVVSPCFSCRHLPSAGASASHRAVASCHAHLGPLVRLVKASPLLTPPPPICGIIESSQRSGLMLV